MDLDFILAEYDRCVPIALIDYKHEHGTINLESANTRTLIALGDMAGIPAFIVRYGHSNQSGWWGEVEENSVPWFQIIPLNSHAHTAGVPSNDDNAKVTELVFVTWLYELRGRKIPQDIADILNK
ncbi:MAG: hypothetical protein EBR82_72755 [Caulobacteraceae bacterium]|nr:hypothetical protein [Caulobacteraceae bacterium]